MKTKFLFFALLSLFVLPVGAFAAEEKERVTPKPCELDITANLAGSDWALNAESDWNNVYMLFAPDGSVWQRTIMVRPEGMVTLKEGEKLVFEGTGQPFSQNQIFIFANNPDENGKLGIPDRGTCFQVESGDKEGRFTFEISGNVYWDMLGQEMVIDSFTRLERTWDQKTLEETNQNFYVGTHMPPKVVTLVGEPDKTEGCRYLCDERPAEEGQAHDILLKSVILDPESLKGKEYLLNNNFKNVGGQRIAVSRYMHNFYGGTEIKDGDPPIENAKEKTTDLAMKSMSMEVLKQIMLGKLDESIRKAPDKPMKRLTAANLRRAANGSAYSKEVQTFAKNIKTMMTSKVEEGARTTAAKEIAKEITSVSKQCDPNAADDDIVGDEYVGGAGFHGCIEIDNVMMRQILPPAPTEGRTSGRDWADDFITLMEFWTDSASPNACILPAEAKASEWSEDVRRFFFNNGNNHGSERRECGWNLTYSFGFAS